MADCGGLIDQVALSLPARFLKDRPSTEWFEPLVPIGNLLKSLPAETEALLLIDPACEGQAGRWLAALSVSCRVRLVPLADAAFKQESPWVQDAFHARIHSHSHPAPVEILTLEGRTEGASFAAFLNIPARDALIDLPGGNQLLGDDFRLVGHQGLVGDSGKGSQITPRLQALDDRPIKIYGYRSTDLAAVRADGDGRTFSPAAGDWREKSLHLEGGLHQFGFHVDQFVSVTGLRRGNRPLLLVAEPHLPEGPIVPLVEDARRRLQASVHVLREQGFEIMRNPVPWVVTPDSGKRLPRLYNNVMIENETRQEDDRPLVWLPQFSDVEPLSVFDRMNREIWEALGFEVVPVFGWSYFASRNGALRCATKVLHRSARSIKAPG